MKKLILSLALLVAVAAPTAAFSWGAHNPSDVDHPEIPNCTVLMGPNHYSNNPNCETVPGGLGSGGTQVTEDDHYASTAYIPYAS